MTAVLVWFVVEKEGAVLMGRRKAGQPPFEGAWTLPGDVMLDDESTSETIERFAKQQLDLHVIGDDFIDTLELTNPSTSSGQAPGTEYDVNVFRALFTGEPRFRESGPFEEMGWASGAEIEDETMEMPERLRGLLQKVLKGSET